jgi:hypothetical protein
MEAVSMPNKSSTFNITVSGGSAVFGNVAQGDQSQLASEQVVKAQEDFNIAIEQLGQAQGLAADELSALKKDLEGVLETGERHAFADMGAAADALIQKYSWALVPLKTLFKRLIL